MMDRWFMVLMKKPAWATFGQCTSLLIRQHLSLSSASSTTSAGDGGSGGQGLNKDVADLQPWRSNRSAAWTVGRRRASLSPSARLFAALKEESCVSEHTDQQPIEEVPGSDSESKLCNGSVHSTATDCDTRSNLCENMSDGLEELSQSSSVPSEEKLQKEHDHESRLRRQNLSPLKRFSDMIPENYWDESKDGSSVKQDLESLIKSDDSSKK